MKPDYAGRMVGRFVMVTHHNTGNSGKMTNGKWWQNGICRLCKDCAREMKVVEMMVRYEK